MEEQKNITLQTAIPIALVIVLLGGMVQVIGWGMTATRNQEAIVVLQDDFKDFNKEVIDRLARIEEKLTK